jgi:hypothetical protein
VQVEVGEHVEDASAVRVGAGQVEQAAELFFALPALLEATGRVGPAHRILHLGQLVRGEGLRGPQ